VATVEKYATWSWSLCRVVCPGGGQGVDSGVFESVAGPFEGRNATLQAKCRACGVSCRSSKRALTPTRFVASRLTKARILSSRRSDLTCTIPTCKSGCGFLLVRSLNGLRLHQTTVDFERQIQFGDILRPREGSAGVFLDPTQAVAHGVRVANEYLSRAAHRCIVVLPHPKRFKKHLPLLVGKIAKTVQRAPTVWIIAARRVLLPAPDRTLIMGSRTGFDRLQDNGGPYQQRLRAHSTARENRRAARRRDGVSADNPRCRSLSSITSTASAARSTMELLGAEVNRAPGSDSNGLPGVKAHDSSQRQKPQRAPGDKATVDRLFLLDLSDNRVVSLVVSKRGGTTTSVQ
jgi:hypothetical protein